MLTAIDAIPTLHIPDSLPNPEDYMHFARGRRGCDGIDPLAIMVADLRALHPELDDADIAILRLAAGDLALEVGVSTEAAMRCIIHNDELRNNLLTIKED